MMNLIIGRIIISALLAVVIIGIMKARKNGGIGCGCGCSGFTKMAQCHFGEKKK